MYRGLMINSAYLHAMVRDLFDSPDYCPNDNPSQLYITHQLAGKLESMMCLLLHLEMNKDHLSEYYQAAKQVLETTELPRYFSCSAK